MLFLRCTGTDLDRSSFVAIAVAVCNKMLPLALFVLVVAVVVVLPKLVASSLFVLLSASRVSRYPPKQID